MPQLDQKSLISRLKKNQLANIYYIYGSDIISVENITRQIVKAAVGDNEEFALTKINGKYIDLSSLEDTIGMMPMMSDYNCILINDYNCEKPLEDMRGRKAEDINKQLFNILKDIPPATVVIFNVTGFEVETRYDYKSRKNVIKDKNKKLADLAAKNGILCECAVKNANELAKDIVNKVSSRGGMIRLENARELAEMCLCDTIAVNNEIDKLCAYAQGREITGDIINLLVRRQNDMTVYKLANAVALMDRNAAFGAIDELNIDNNNKMLILTVVSGTFVDLYRAACAIKSGKSIDDTVRDFGYPANRAFVMKNAFRDCSGMSINRLRDCVKIMRDTAVQFSSSSTEPRIILEQAVTKMLMTKNQRRIYD
ncbi:MAG: DNA polymerase III subunit delta [Ruminococcus sp.]|nr:DNA polymerase III subunit delta [Ruminococcus sp.]